MSSHLANTSAAAAGGGHLAPGSQQASEQGRTQRAAAAKATDRGKQIAEMILECNEDGEEEVRAHPAHGSSSEFSRASGGAAEDEAVEEEYDGGGNGAVYRRKPIKTRWSAAEDSKLKDSVDAHGSGNWKLVS